LPWADFEVTMGRMSGTSIGRRPKKRAGRGVPTELRKRVGAFIRARREELGLSQGDIIRALGYKNLASVSNLEQGIEGLPVKRAYAWADVLQVPRDPFFRFVTGEISRMTGTSSPQPPQLLNGAEEDLVSTYRRLPPKYQRRLREQAKDFEWLAEKIKKHHG
jgi:transcriptional regulator with XRE-family HTH domain